MNAPPLPRVVRLKIAAEAETDPRPVASYFDRGAYAVRPATRRAIRNALAKLGIPDPWPANDQHGGDAA